LQKIIAPHYRICSSVSQNISIIFL